MPSSCLSRSSSLLHTAVHLLPPSFTYVHCILFITSYHLSVLLLFSFFPWSVSLLSLFPPSCSVSPESLIWYLSRMGPINPASLCLFSSSLIRMHTGDILLLLTVGDWRRHLSNLSRIIYVCVWESVCEWVIWMHIEIDIDRKKSYSQGNYNECC